MNYTSLLLYTFNKDQYAFADGVSPLISLLHPPELELVDRYSVVEHSWASTNACSSEETTGTENGRN